MNATTTYPHSTRNSNYDSTVIKYPKLISWRNIGDYLRQHAYLWVNIGDNIRQPFLWSIMSEFTIIYCYKRYSAHNRQ